MRKFIQSWVVNTLAVLVAVYVVPGLHYQRPLDLLVASLILGILNAVLRPVLMFLALPLLIFTLGLFTLIINALLLYFVANLLQPHFVVDGFWHAFWGALVISVVSIVLNVLTGSARARVHIQRPRNRRQSNGGDDGPVIDI